MWPFEVEPIDIALNCLKGAVVSLAIWGGASWKAQRLPSRLTVAPVLMNEPIQSPTLKLPLQTQRNGNAYQIQPVFEYEIWGLVVSDHNSSGWDDYEHARWNDYLNTKDICVIWGANLSNSHLADLKFSHGQWTCYVQTKSGEAWQEFQINKLSNNHLLPASAQIEKIIRRAHVGDEIHIQGQLVNYSVNNGPPRNSSITRDDTENGACEIIYVDDFEIIARHNILWIQIATVSQWIAGALGVGFLFFFFGGAYLKKS